MFFGEFTLAADPTYVRAIVQPVSQARPFKETDIQELKKLDPDFVFMENDSVWVIEHQEKPNTKIGYYVLNGKGREQLLRYQVAYPHMGSDLEEMVEWHLNHESKRHFSIARMVPASDKGMQEELKGRGYIESPQRSEDGQVAMVLWSKARSDGSETRWMLSKDLDEVVEGEKQRGGAGLTEKQLNEARRKRNVIVMVTERHGKIVGHTVYKLHRNMLQLISLAAYDSNPATEKGVIENFIYLLSRKLSQQRRTHLSINPDAGSPEVMKAIAELPNTVIQETDEGKRLVHSNRSLIAENLQRQNFFFRLGVDAWATDAQIKEAASHLIGDWQSSDSNRLLQEAEKVLTDPRLRSKYLNENRALLIDHRDALFGPRAAYGIGDLYRTLGIQSKNLQGQAIDRAYEINGLLYGHSELSDLAYKVLSEPNLRNVYDSIIATSEGEQRALSLQSFQERVLKGEPVIPKTTGKPANNIGFHEDFSKNNLLKITTANPKSENLYQRLGVPENADYNTIMSAYIDARRKFKETKEISKINEAWRVLRWELLRGRYDRLMVGDSLDKEKIAELIRSSPKVDEQLKTEGPLKGRTKFNSVKPKSQNLYQRLGVGENASPERILWAYQTLAKEKRMKAENQSQIMEAYLILFDPVRREAYDLLTYESRTRGGVLGEDTFKVLATGDWDELEFVVSDEVHKHPDQERLLKRIKARRESEAMERIVGGNSFYAKLGVPSDATAELIEKRFQEISEPERTHEIRQAHAVLSNELLRTRYDDAIPKTLDELDDYEREIDRILTLATHTIELTELRRIARDRTLDPLTRFEKGKALGAKFHTSQVTRLFIEEVVSELEKQPDEHKGIRAYIGLAAWVEEQRSKLPINEHTEIMQKSLDAVRLRLLSLLVERCNGQHNEYLEIYAGLDPSDPVMSQMLSFYSLPPPDSSDSQTSPRSGPIEGPFSREFLSRITTKAEATMTGFEIGRERGLDTMRQIQTFAQFGLANGASLSDYERLVEIIEEMFHFLDQKVHESMESYKETVIKTRDQLFKALAAKFGQTRSELRAVRKLYPTKLRQTDSVQQAYEQTYRARLGMISTVIQACRQGLASLNSSKAK